MAFWASIAYYQCTYETYEHNAILVVVGQDGGQIYRVYYKNHAILADKPWVSSLGRILSNTAKWKNNGCTGSTLLLTTLLRAQCKCEFGFVKANAADWMG